MLQLNELLPPSEAEPYLILRGKEYESLSDNENYAVLEYFCTNPTCPCESVSAQIVKVDDELNLVGQPVASIYYKWSSPNKRCQPELAEESLRTAHALRILEAYKNIAQINEYTERLKIHYALVRKLAAQNSNLGLVIPLIHTKPKIRRNDPCPCGSKKKHKKCCYHKKNLTLNENETD